MSQKAKRFRPLPRKVKTKRWERDRNKKYIAYYLSHHPCVDCNEKDPIVLEFDHVRGVKAGCVREIARDYPLDMVKEEIAKCEVRCANCHKRRHHLCPRPNGN